MKLYIASSWKNAAACAKLAVFLRQLGHEVDCFSEPRPGRGVFCYSELTDVLADLDAINFLRAPRVQRAFLEDLRWLDWAEGVVLYLPCGRSAHLEAGYAVGQGKRLVIYGEFRKGEFDVMYGFAHALVREGDLDRLSGALKEETPCES